MARCSSWLVASVASLSLALLGCAPEARPPLEVGYSALRISLPIFVAERRGLFARHGVRVRLRRYETAQPLVEEVLDGREQLETALAALGDGPQTVLPPRIRRLKNAYERTVG